MTMKTAGAICTLILAGFALTACGPGDAAEAGPTSQAAAATFAARPDLSPTAQALPRMVGDSPQIAAINTDLEMVDAMDAANIADCEGDGGAWNRSIRKVMTGPGYVTFWVAQDYECGGPYPATSQTAVTYDLTTGRRVDWVAAIPGLGLVADSLDDLPAGYVVNVRSAALARWYGTRMLASPETEWINDCRSAFAPEQLANQGFRIWADAQAGGVSVSPDFPHVAQACAETATLTPADLRGFGANPVLIDAIAAAHAGRHWDVEDAA